jgi:hypothetical protein
MANDLPLVVGFNFMRTRDVLVSFGGAIILISLFLLIDIYGYSVRSSIPSEDTFWEILLGVF